MKLIYHQLENEGNDPHEYNFLGYNDLWDWIKVWAGNGYSPRVFMSCFSDGTDNDMNKEIVVSASTSAVRGLVYDQMKLINSSVNTLHIQEFSDFQSAYEVAFYIREGHPLAYPPTND
jgi:hypothetical protein